MMRRRASGGSKLPIHDGYGILFAANSLFPDYYFCNNVKMVARESVNERTLYRKTFIDNIDKENLPEGRRMGTLGEMVNIKVGGDNAHNITEGENMRKTPAALSKSAKRKWNFELRTI